MTSLSRDMISSVHFVDLKEKGSGHTIYPPSLTAVTSMAWKLRRGGGGGGEGGGGGSTGRTLSPSP